MPHRSLNCSELFISPLFGDPISNQCLCGFRLTGGASALRYILLPVLWFPLGFILDPCQSPQAPRSPSVPDLPSGPRPAPPAGPQSRSPAADPLRPPAELLPFAFLFPPLNRFAVPLRTNIRYLYLYFQARVCAALRESPIISFYYIHTFRFADTRPYARALIPFFTYCHTFSLTGSDGQDRASGDDQGLSALHGAKTFSEQFYDRSAGIRICKKNARRWMI